MDIVEATTTTTTTTMATTTTTTTTATDAITRDSSMCFFTM